jgi:hypothetical protein
VAPAGPAMLLVLEQRLPRPQTLPDHVDGILVPGGALDPGLSLAYGETVFNSSVARVLAGIALARRYPDAKLALVGGEGEMFPGGFTEARATSGFVIDEGIAAARIIIEERSRSTHEKAVFAKESIRRDPPKPGSWLLRLFICRALSPLSAPSVGRRSPIPSISKSIPTRFGARISTSSKASERPRPPARSGPGSPATGCAAGRKSFSRRRVHAETYKPLSAL